MIEMSSSEYGKLFDELYAKFEAGEITAEEVCAEMWKVDRVVHSGPPLRNLPEELDDDMLDEQPSNNT